MKRSWTTYILIGGLAILLVALGVLQYRWLGQISATEGEKARERVKGQAGRFAEDFNREIQHVYINFQTEAEGWKNKDRRQFNERYDTWLTHSDYPQLVSEFYFFEADPATPLL